MKLSEFKKKLGEIEKLSFQLANGNPVPEHFHITEAGMVTKHFIDCGGTQRQEKYLSLQLWTAEDTDHRLHPEKLLSIILLYENFFGNEDLEIEVEYQSSTIGRYGLQLNQNIFILTDKYTNCLAPDKCGIDKEKPKIKLSELTINSTSCCSPGGKCC
ncbi:MAG: DUF6428 family protein [Bacteroidota bacterium]|jgi:hypothetical protein